MYKKTNIIVSKLGTRPIRVLFIEAKTVADAIKVSDILYYESDIVMLNGARLLDLDMKLQHGDLIEVYPEDYLID